MYKSYFKLTMKPFELLPNPDFLFLSRSHRKVLMYLDYGIQERAAFILLTGAIGSGKTTIIRDLIKKRDRRVVLSKIFNTKVNSDQLLAMVNDDFGLSSQGKDKITLLRELNDFLIDQFVQGNQPILIIDEAQNLSVDLLEEIRMLSNLETDQAKLLQIILVGQPELRETLASPALMQLRQRIKINCTIQPLTAAETEQYILHRLETAGNREAVVFSWEALNAIFSYSRGIPRLINIICDFLMLAAFAEETSRIDRELVTDIIGDLDFENHFWGESATIWDNPDDCVALPWQRIAAADKEITATHTWTRECVDNYSAEHETITQDTFPERPAIVSTIESSEKDPPTAAPCSPAPPEGNTSRAVNLKREEESAVKAGTGNRGPGSGTCYGKRQKEAVGKKESFVKEGFLRRVFSASGFKFLAAVGFLLLAVGFLLLSTTAGASEFTLQPPFSLGKEYTDNLYESSTNKRADYFTLVQPGFTLQPSLTVGEEYTDNVYESSTNKRADYITHVQPGIDLQYKAPLWDWDIRYVLDYRHYARGSHTDDFANILEAKGHINIIKEFMFLDLSDTYSRTSLNVSRDTTPGSLFVNQSDYNIFAASPYFLWRLGTMATLKTGYQYANTWYREPTGIDKRDQSAFAEITHKFTEKASATAVYNYTHENSATSIYDRHDAYAGGRYEYADKSFVYAQAGNSWIQYSITSSVSNPLWNAGIIHDFVGTVASLKAGTAYVEDPQRSGTIQTSYVADVTKKIKRGDLGLTAAYAELKNSGLRSFQTKSYGGTVRCRYELLPKLTGILAFTAENIDQKNQGSYTRILVDSGLSYLLGEGLTMALNYKYIDYNSSTIATENYQVNRVILEITKTFARNSK